MTMTRRHFLASLGVGAAIVALGVPAAAEAQTTIAIQDYPLLVGDVITIGGRYAVNPTTMKPTQHLQQFVVTSINEYGATLSPSIEGTPRVKTTRVRQRFAPPPSVTRRRR